ncbi:MAG: methyltransferase domain-containing protein [Candidatus Marinimicrobia bacterium]|nr:methyltransferase domain-containing protein [Candidatus Neomarinimicrobiota bacterium]MCF7829962.1 methyltransferase domain-containing protein [Candidatus Neomarinimicrobiota bacterium]MCF7881884.1 methyltransferase domain-containing protein [Candidatus Neomarinimicrobiota bacterium]
MDLEQLRSKISAFRESRIIYTALHWRLFDFIKDGNTAKNIAESAETDSRGTERLLNALVAMEILQKDNGKFRHTELSRRYLTESSPESQLESLLHSGQSWKNWSDLPEIVKTGELPERKRVFDDPERYRTFILAMHDYQEEQAPEVVRQLEVKPNARILDCGGGPGTYARAFAREYPQAAVTLFDLPDAIEIAKEFESPPQNLDYRSGDFFLDDLGGSYDLVFLSNIIHSHSPERNKILLRRIAEALASGGELIIRDRYLDETGTVPKGAVIFGLHMLVNNLEGGTYTVDETQKWLRETGFENPDYRTIENHTEVVIGYKE